MNATPEFIVVGRMLDPVQAGIFHLSALEPMKVHVFLRDLRPAWEAQGQSLNLVLFADRFLEARVSQLKILKKAISLSGFQVAGVMGDHEHMWAEALDTMVIGGKPRLSLDFPSMKLRNEFLKTAYPPKESEQLEQLVQECLKKVDTVAAQIPEIPTIASYLAQAQEERDAADEKKAQEEAEAARIAEETRLAEEQRLADEAEQARQEELRVAREADEARLAEEQRLAQEAEEARVAEQQRIAEEVARVAEEQRLADIAEQARLEEVRLTQEAEEARLLEEARIAETERADETQRRVQEAEQVARQLQQYIDSQPVVETVNVERQASHTNTAPLRVTGRIRSGQVLEHEGSIIIEGAIHPGGVVRAHGDIHVYGTAGGKLQAGANGNANACIYIQAFDAEIVEIAGKYRVFEDVEDRWAGRAVKVSLQDGTLFFEEMTPLKQRQVA